MKGKISNTINPATASSSGTHLWESDTRKPGAQDNPGEKMSNTSTPDETRGGAAKKAGKYNIS